MLAAYRTNTANLLQLPAAPTTLYATADLDNWINIARGQIAGEGECVRVLGTISTVIGQRNYNFSAINTGVSATNGVAGTIHVRAVRYAVGEGYQWMRPRNWEWFDLYKMNTPVPPSGAPQVWSQYAQGSIPISGGSDSSGSFYVDPIPDLIYVLTCDCVCFPTPLVDDTTKEALPYLWTDAVPFFAAYYALMSAQTGARYADAERLFTHYETFMARARQAANPSVNRYLYQQSTDPTLLNKLGQVPRQQSGGG